MGAGTRLSAVSRLSMRQFVFCADFTEDRRIKGQNRLLPCNNCRLPRTAACHRESSPFSRAGAGRKRSKRNPGRTLALNTAHFPLLICDPGRRIDLRLCATFQIPI
jgi:hypothetical protein